MLLSARSFDLSKIPDRGRDRPHDPYFDFTVNVSKKEHRAAQRHALKMLLIHQAGSVKVGEVVRYTVTYTPSEDRILPTPTHLHVRIKNTCALPLRAAWMHGPYTLHVAAYPSHFNPNRKLENPRREGVPQFEPNVKAAGSWQARLAIPEDIREQFGSTSGVKRNAEGQPKSVTWVIDIMSQIIFSPSASIEYELLVSRDEKSLDLGFAAVGGQSRGQPGQVEDHQQGRHQQHHRNSSQPKGVYSRAIKLVVDDVVSLWNRPPLPSWDDREDVQQKAATAEDNVAAPANEGGAQPPDGGRQERKQKKIHLVVLSHGLHSNVSADMLYLKESIDAAAKEAREASRKRRREERERKRGKAPSSKSRLDDGASSTTAVDDEAGDSSTAPLSGGQDEMDDEEEDDDDEQIIVRGFGGNTTRTEKGIQYLGKRLAKYILALTYPDQPFIPLKKSMTKKISESLSGSKNQPSGEASHHGSSVHHEESHLQKRAFRFTSISFVGHSLGGVVQVYAIGYIQKHSPQFFERIQPINFIAMASPFLGLSNENPSYVKFALDFGLVGRTGQDLGLTWRPPTIARSGWSAVVGGLGGNPQKTHEHGDPGAKPLLRILPTGPAHFVLRRFRNRTLYSNVVNDGIVPLRTACLLFLDWRGLGKVDKARRENGLVGTMMNWGLAEITGQNASPDPSRLDLDNDDDSEDVDAKDPRRLQQQTSVPQPSDDATTQDNNQQQTKTEPETHQFLQNQQHSSTAQTTTQKHSDSATGLFWSLWGHIRPSGAFTKRDANAFGRSQTVQPGDPEDDDPTAAEELANANGEIAENAEQSNPQERRKRPMATRGDSIINNPKHLKAPPKTTIFESAGDVLAPPLAPLSWIIDPSSRQRTIFHDRVYHPEDIPPPPAKRRPSMLGRSFSTEGNWAQQPQDNMVDADGMKVEEKIARAYHKDLSWRKVLVRLEPDAHNNMVVRRMFANAYGWPVIKHLCDTHFADTYTATTRDEDEPAFDRAQAVGGKASETGDEVKHQTDKAPPPRSNSELREGKDELAPLREEGSVSGSASRAAPRRLGSTASLWDDRYFDGDSDDDEEGYGADQKPGSPKSAKKSDDRPSLHINADPPSHTEIADQLTFSPPPMEYHRGLSPSTEIVPTQSSFSSTPRDADSLEPFHSHQHSETGSRPGSSAKTPGGTTEIGLRRSLDKSFESPNASPAKPRSRSGVAEEVARLSLTKDRET